MSDLKNLTRRPEFAAFVGTLFVFIFFGYFGWPTFTTSLVTAGWLNVAAELGLIALPVSLVMVAGHLDLSVGSILAAGAMTYAIITGHFELPDIIGLPAGLAVGTFFGYLNGLIITKTKLSSFIVTLGTMFGLRGLVFGITRLTTSTVPVSIKVSETVRSVFGGRLYLTFENAIVIWVIMAIVVSWILYKTQYGNWIFALGGDETFARAAGERVAMFMDAVGPYIDVYLHGDDYGMQTGPQISPAMFREFFKPRHKKIWGLVKEKNPDIMVMLHSCGSIYALLPDMIDAGLDAVNPVHTNCAMMEPERLKSEFRDQITFWGGGCNTQHVLPNGTPQEVREEVLYNLDILAPGGGFIFQQIHNIQADIRPENIVAMFDAVTEWNEKNM